MGDSLLDELNGKLGGGLSGELVDPAPQPAPSRVSELELPAKPQTSATAQANMAHSTAAGGKGFKVWLKGEYSAATPGGKSKIKKPYTAEVNVSTLDSCLSVVRNKLIKPLLRAKYPDFVSVRTIYIVKTAPLSSETPKSRNLAYLDLPDLIEYVKEAKAPIDAASYSDVVHLRDAITDWIQTPDGFEAREAVRQAGRASDNELAMLNPSIEVGA